MAAAFAFVAALVTPTPVVAADCFTPLPAPQRLADSRPEAVTVDGQFAGGGVRASDSTLALQVTGRAGVPAGAAAVVLNVTADAAAEPGFVTVHAGGASRPNASNLNFSPGATVAASVITRLDPAGRVCLYSFGATHLIVDVVGVLAGPPPPTGSTGCPDRQPPGSQTAVAVLHAIPVGLEQPSGYDRDLFPHWLDLDGNG